MERLKSSLTWFWQTSRLVGAPVLFFLLISLFSKFFFTTTCITVGYKCQFSLGVSEAAQQYLTSLVGGEAEIEVRPTNKTR